MKRLAILGSTGSIGNNALKIVSRYPERFKIIGLTAGKNINLLMKQIEAFKPEVIAISDKATYDKFKDSFHGSEDLEILYGVEGISMVARHPRTDIVISAIVGSAGLLPTMAAVKAGKTVALANKETLVMAGNLIMHDVGKNKATLIPVDSEHSAIFQCLRGDGKNSLKKIILTASGGPFLGRTAKALENVSPEDALQHPKWSMGKKVTIDSATLMNKGLEVIEAHYLFDLPPEQIDVLIHPQSVIHSIVEFRDGSYMAQLSRPDMKGPIAYALSYPERLQDIVEPIDWEKLSGLTFQKPDRRTFPCLSLAYAAIKTGGTMPAVLNAANEVVVKAFLDGNISFNNMPTVIRKVMDTHQLQPPDNLEVILEADRWAQEKTREEMGKK
ncbi:MAG: 1-deoxy-D-xylulose-5-phosphate reductoisomerase [Dissulfurispiraceae bacterium]